MRDMRKVQDVIDALDGLEGVPLRNDARHLMGIIGDYVQLENEQ